MTTYLANGFSPSMLSTFPADLQFKEVGQEEFCQATKHSINSIGHNGTIELVNKLCGSDLQVNRVAIKLNIGDEIYIITLVARLEEGKILKSDEIQRLYEEGKIKFIRAKIYEKVGDENDH